MTELQLNNKCKMKIVSLNIERNKHLKSVLDFLKKESPDVVCLQEAMRDSAQVMAKNVGMYITFTPMAILSGFEEDAEMKEWGVAILTKEKHKVLGMHYYQGTSELQVYKSGKWDTSFHSLISRVAPVVSFSKNNKEFVISTTHFTYTPDGFPDEWQINSSDNLINKLSQYEDIILCGDFNVPRGNEIYDKFNNNFIDNIPQKYDSSIDPELHRVPGLKRMVDYMWTRGGYSVGSINFKNGISDHMAIVAEVS